MLACVSRSLFGIAGRTPLACCALALSLGAANAQTTHDPQHRYHVVSLKCPSDNGGVFEISKLNEMRDLQLIRVTYQNGAAINLLIQHPRRTDPEYFVNLRTENNPAILEVANLYVGQAHEYLSHYCLSGLDERRAAKAELEENLKKWGP